MPWQSSFLFFIRLILTLFLSSLVIVLSNSIFPSNIWGRSIFSLVIKKNIFNTIIRIPFYYWFFFIKNPDSLHFFIFVLWWKLHEVISNIKNIKRLFFNIVFRFLWFWIISSIFVYSKILLRKTTKLSFASFNAILPLLMS